MHATYKILLLTLALSALVAYGSATPSYIRTIDEKDFRAGTNAAINMFTVFDTCVPHFYNDTVALRQCLDARYASEFDENILGILHSPGSEPIQAQGYSNVLDMMAGVGTFNKGETHTFGELSKAQYYPDDSESFCIGNCYAIQGNPPLFQGWAYAKYFSTGTSLAKDMLGDGFTLYTTDYTWIIKSRLCPDNSRTTRIVSAEVRIKMVTSIPHAGVFEVPPYQKVYNNNCASL